MPEKALEANVSMFL